MLTDAKARNTPPGSAPLAHGGITGLCLHPSPTRKGKGKWVLRYVSPVTKRRRNAGLGVYPDVGIAQAGKLRQSMRELLATGQDPLDTRQIVNDQPRTPTLKQAAVALHEELKPGWKNEKHAQQWINTLTEYVFPVLGQVPLDQVQARHVADALRPIWLDKPETASRVKQRLHAVMAWGWAHGFNQANPVDVVTHLLPLQPGKTARTQHQPAMPWRLLPSFVRIHLSDMGEYEVVKRMLLFLILTASRSGEVRGMKWEEIDWSESLWVVPASRMKAKQIHRIPLAPQLLTLLEIQQGHHETLVFPPPFPRIKKSAPQSENRITTPTSEISDMSLTSFLRRSKALSDTPDRYATAHGFRSTFRDWCSENGFAKDLAERSLSHTIPNKVEAAYHRTDLLDNRVGLMQAWAHFVLGMTSIDQPDGMKRNHE